MTTPTLTKPALSQPLTHVTALAVTSHPLDLSRGARHYGIHPDALFVESDVLDDYAEVDVSLGENVVGAILAVLGCQREVRPLRVPDGMFSVCLLRRDDARLVEVGFHLDHVHHRGQDYLVLRKTVELELELESAA